MIHPCCLNLKMAHHHSTSKCSFTGVLKAMLHPLRWVYSFTGCFVFAGFRPQSCCCLSLYTRHIRTQRAWWACGVGGLHASRHWNLWWNLPQLGEVLGWNNRKSNAHRNLPKRIEIQIPNLLLVTTFISGKVSLPILPSLFVEHTHPTPAKCPWRQHPSGIGSMRKPTCWSWERWYHAASQ